MDRLDAMRLFTRIVERRSFTAAAHDSDVPRSTVTQVIKKMETRLGVQLLQRSTRTVRPTLDGEAYYKRCLAILDDIDDAEGAFRGSTPKGLLRVEVQGTLARYFLTPGLPDFFERYPGIEISMTEHDEWVDLVHEGVDCALRWGDLPDSSLIAKRLGLLERVTCASPAYFDRFGFPETTEALQGHRHVGRRLPSTGSVRPLMFEICGETHNISLPTILSVTGSESYREAARLGLGLAQMPRFHVEDDLKNGRLVSVLESTPPPGVPVSVVYPQSRQLSPRVRVFVDWLSQRFIKGFARAAPD
ncbi:LysR family transcriptional regulator [uncultured Roseibium sp.]|uniref:LysR family transcriptional regulator n=1 Tax=uncultured Roseibium sp. TaxID=1936171 RepID=UPI002612ED7C|nr:LysR family transcriptional regulator [uncultured Roseibium sp.]